MKKSNKNAFTLVELLAVIVILAIILVIAIPQIISVIKAARLSSIKDSAMLIAEQADKDFLSQQVLNKDYNESSIPCSDVAKLNNDYGYCKITYNNGVATVKLKGKDGGKFSGIICKGTKDNMQCEEKVALPGYSDAVELLTSKIGTGGLIKDNHNDLRYQGSTVNNYARFNCADNDNSAVDTCEVWRIIGLFNVDGVQRVKLVRNDALGSYSWDSSIQSGEGAANNGYGINQWGESETYEGADLMRELNTNYLNTNLTENPTWYNGNNNTKTREFDKSMVLKESAQELIGEATWYTGGVPSSTTVTLTEAYAGERGTQGKLCTSGSNCNDTVERTYTWTGKVGLIYLSDFGYASSNRNCATDMYTSNNCNNNWLGLSTSWTITPLPKSSNATFVWYTTMSYINNHRADVSFSIRPTVYLISGIQIKGSGTSSDPYVFAE